MAKTQIGSKRRSAPKISPTVNMERLRKKKRAQDQFAAQSKNKAEVAERDIRRREIKSKQSLPRPGDLHGAYEARVAREQKAAKQARGKRQRNKRRAEKNTVASFVSPIYDKK